MTTFICICEGKSEEIYLQELNKYFREKGIEINLVPHSADTGHFKEVVKKYKNERSKNKKGNFCIWVDKDIYERNEKKNNDSYEKKSDSIPNFCFNYLNFEDFLVLHCRKDIVLNYQRLCKERDHFNTPMKAYIYMDLIKENVFSDYKKGSLPNDFKISDESLNRLFSNNNDQCINFKSGFAEFLQGIIPKKQFNK